MFVYTMSKKRAFRTALIILAVFVGIAIGIASILTAVNTGAAESRLPIYSVERGDNKIALTFDCAWGNSNTDELLKILSNADVRATFFVTGEFCDKYPDDVRKFFEAGHEIANHSDKHPHIKGININDFINDTKECSRKIKMLTGAMPALYRAPYGEYDNNTISTITGMSMNFIQWSVDSIDWQEPDAATITKRILDKTVSGSILLFHNDLANTTEALPGILTSLTQKGFSFAKVSDMIYTGDFSIDHTGKQIKTIKTIVSDTETYSASLTVNTALETLRSGLSLDELSALKDGMTPQSIAKISELLTSEQIEAVSGLSAEEYKSAWNNLMAAKERDAIDAVAEDTGEGTIGEPASEENETAENTENVENTENTEYIEPMKDGGNETLYDEVEYEEEATGESEETEEAEYEENGAGVDMSPYLNESQINGLEGLYEQYAEQIQENATVKGEAENIKK